MYKIAIVGAGNMASKYISVIKSYKELSISGVFSRGSINLNKIKTKFGVPVFNYKYFKKYYKDINPDAVIICVSEQNTFKVLRNISKFRTIILCEKPIGINYLESTKILKLLNKSYANAYVALNRRYYQSTLKLLKILKNYKKKRIVEAIDQQDQQMMISVGKTKKVVNNLMYANSVHIIDYANIICRGYIKKITNNKILYSKDKYIILSEVNFSSGDKFLYKGYWNIPQRWSIKIFLDKNIFLLKPLESLVKKTKKKFNTYKLNKVDKYFKPGLKILINELIKRIKNKRNLLISFRKHMQTINLIRRIYQKV
jgi:predicted dehydrogenase